VDLEAQDKNAQGVEEVVPVAHVRRLTGTLVDILRHVATASAANKDVASGSDLGAGASESSALLADTASELSYDDKLSSYSKVSRESDAMSVQTALLKAAYMPQQEYKGKCNQ
jgi:hypothetical protein